MAALSTHKIQSGKETVVAKRLTLLQVCLLSKHFNLVFSVVINGLYSMCICVMFIYLSIFFTFYAQAIETRDAIAKFIYSSLFEWIVQQLNRLLEVNEKHTGKSISILDFYGFQSFQVGDLY